MADLTIPQHILDDIVSHARELAPYECCGLLAGTDKTVTTIYRIKNIVALEGDQHLSSFDAAKAKTIPGVQEVVAVETGVAVVATNTSALSITEMAGALTRPARVGGMHFFNPVHKMKLIEIVRALESSDETLETIAAVAQAMGKETVVVREAPGFITTRVNASIGNEAFYMLMEGVASARDIDKALKLGLNHPMGPFELVDLVGLDTRLSILEYLHRTMGEKYRPCPLLVQYVKAGRLGKKVGKGVYEY